MLSEKEFLQDLEALMTGFWLSDLPNFSAHLFSQLPDLNWVGFYLSDGKVLRLGPFSGKPACTEIAFHRGVCGASFSQRKPLIVDDVDQFPDHIVCDSVSRSEMVIPLQSEGECFGVLDLDSPNLARFKNEDLVLVSKGLEILLSKNKNLKQSLQGLAGPVR